MTDKPYNELKLRPDQMLSPQNQAINGYKDQAYQSQNLDNQLNGRQTAGGNIQLEIKERKKRKVVKHKKYSDKNPIYNRIRNPETNRYVNVDSTQGRKILRSYLENYSNMKNV